ncbi:transposase [Candidatus Sumerlaeota bacterium]|nr:transposase [Candidatus Sumerlaeota bacterium]
MQGKRRRIPAALKAKVALEALAGEKTTNEIAGKYEVHPNQVAAWKKQLRESAADFFADALALFIARGALPDLPAKPPPPEKAAPHDKPDG